MGIAGTLSNILLSLLDVLGQSQFPWIWDEIGERVLGVSQVVLVVKNLPASAGDARDTGLILELGRSPAEGNGYPLQFSCLGNPRGAWRATVQGGHKELDMAE